MPNLKFNAVVCNINQHDRRCLQVFSHDYLCDYTCQLSEDMSQLSVGEWIEIDTEFDPNEGRIFLTTENTLVLDTAKRTDLPHAMDSPEGVTLDVYIMFSTNPEHESYLREVAWSPNLDRVAAPTEFERMEPGRFYKVSVIRASPDIADLFKVYWQVYDGSFPKEADQTVQEAYYDKCMKQMSEQARKYPPRFRSRHDFDGPDPKSSYSNAAKGAGGSRGFNRGNGNGGSGFRNKGPSPTDRGFNKKFGNNRNNGNNEFYWSKSTHVLLRDQLRDPFMCILVRVGNRSNGNYGLAWSEKTSHMGIDQYRESSSELKNPRAAKLGDWFSAQCTHLKRAKKCNGIFVEKIIRLIDPVFLTRVNGNSVEMDLPLDVPLDPVLDDQELAGLPNNNRFIAVSRPQLGFIRVERRDYDDIRGTRVYCTVRNIPGENSEPVGWMLVTVIREMQKGEILPPPPGLEETSNAGPEAEDRRFVRRPPQVQIPSDDESDEDEEDDEEDDDEDYDPDEPHVRRRHHAPSSRGNAEQNGSSSGIGTGTSSHYGSSSVGRPEPSYSGGVQQSEPVRGYGPTYGVDPSAGRDRDLTPVQQNPPMREERQQTTMIGGGYGPPPMLGDRAPIGVNRPDPHMAMFMPDMKSATIEDLGIITLCTSSGVHIVYGNQTHATVLEKAGQWDVGVGDWVEFQAQKLVTPIGGCSYVSIGKVKRIDTMMSTRKPTQDIAELLTLTIPSDELPVRHGRYLSIYSEDVGELFIDYEGVMVDNGNIVVSFEDINVTPWAVWIRPSLIDNEFRWMVARLQERLVDPHGSLPDPIVPPRYDDTMRIEISKVVHTFSTAIGGTVVDTRPPQPQPINVEQIRSRVEMISPVSSSSYATAQPVVNRETRPIPNPIAYQQPSSLSAPSRPPVLSHSHAASSSIQQPSALEGDLVTVISRMWTMEDVKRAVKIQDYNLYEKIETILEKNAPNREPSRASTRNSGAGSSYAGSQRGGGGFGDRRQEYGGQAGSTRDQYDTASERSYRGEERQETRQQFGSQMGYGSGSSSFGADYRGGRDMGGTRFSVPRTADRGGSSSQSNYYSGREDRYN